MICHKCNFENDDDARFCEQCGAELVKESHNNNIEEDFQTKENTPNNRRKSVLFLVTALIAVSIVGAVVLYLRDLSSRYFCWLNGYDNELITVVKSYTVGTCAYHKYGFVRNNRPWYSEVIPPQYDAAGRFYGHVAPVCVEGDRWGFIQENNDVIINFQYDYARDFGEGLAPVLKTGKWGYINVDNEVIIPFQYDNALSLHDGVMAVKKDEKWGFIDRHGHEVIGFIFDEIEPNSNGIPVFYFAESGSDGTYIYKDGRKGEIWKISDNVGNVSYNFREL